MCGNRPQTPMAFDNGTGGNLNPMPIGDLPFPWPPGPPGGPFPPWPGPSRPPIPQAFPPLPNIRFLRGGCWLTTYEPLNSPAVAYDGTIRIEHSNNGTTASGDLYQRPVLQIPQLPPQPPRTLLLPPPRPADGVPIQARSKYRYFLRITNIPERFIFGHSFRLDFEMWRFIAGSNTWSNGPESTVTASMSWMTPPSGCPGAYLEGDVRNVAGNVTGRLKMGWISDSYRKITIEIDTVSGPPPERPLDNGSGESWATVFGAVGYEVALHPGDTDVSEPAPGDESFTDAEMHTAMLERREPINLDTTWHYHILAVKLIDSTERGIMYDSGITDSDNVPREGVGVASQWKPNKPVWGEVNGKFWGSNKAAYFRTAVHELGHALGLEHNFSDTGFMCTSDTIAASPGGPFPKQIKWAFNDEDLKRLRHWPDVFIRPGGVPFGGAMGSALPMTPTDLDIEPFGLTLKVTAAVPEVPIGAPVRVNLRLTNVSESSVQVPASVSLKSPFLSGTVTAAFITPRTVSPMIHCTDSNPLQVLTSGDYIDGSITLLRGTEGPLFPTTGLYTVTASLAWPTDGSFSSRISGSCTVFVTPAVADSHAAAAHSILESREAQILLMAGGDSERLAKGQTAINAAMQDETLKQHFASIEAKRVARGYKGRKGDAKKATELLKGAVMSDGERKTLEKLGVKSG